MTVIAWDGKVLAADSLETDSNGYMLGMCKKLYRLKSGGMLGTAGDSDCRALMGLVENVKDENDLPTRAEIEATKTAGSYILVLPDKSVFMLSTDVDEDLKAVKAEVVPYKGKCLAVGHGQDFARAAMSVGKTSAEAVKVACKWSVVCGGPIQTMKLEDKPKEKIKRVRRKPPIGDAE